MAFTNVHSLGIDIGSGGAKAVYLQQKKGGQQFLQTVCLNRYAEGLLDENELLDALQEWLAVNRLLEVQSCCGISPRVTSTVMRRFPQGDRNGGSLQLLADYEAKRLHGLSDEPFCYDNQDFGSCAENPSWSLQAISVCREAIASRNLQFYQKLGIMVDGIADNAQALANAFFNLRPEAAAAEGLQAILDVGQEETVIVIWQDGVPIRFSSIPLGGFTLTQALAMKWHCSEAVAERRKREEDQDWLQPDSPGNQALRGFLGEMQKNLNALLAAEDGGEGEVQVKSPVSFTKIWLSGGASLHHGLERICSREFQCPVEIFGVPRHQLSGTDCPPGYDFVPSLTIAYGLALQGAGLAKLKMSLLPLRHRWQLRKEREFPFLLGGCQLLVLTVLLAMGILMLRLQRKADVLTGKMQNLESCRELVPLLEEKYAAIAHCQRQMLPIAEYGSRAKRYAEALKACQEVLNEKTIGRPVSCIYLADEFSFAAENGVAVTAGDDARSAQHRQPTALTPGEIFNLEGKGVERLLDKDQTLTNVSSLPILKNMFLGGLTVQDQTEYHTVKEIQLKFHEQTEFSNVDDYMDLISPTFSAKYLSPWEKFVLRPEVGTERQYGLFFLQLPFRENLTSGQDITVKP
ncbi:MAG: pilus assembly protein PilM [Victivallales bacterium]|nr:pilus assembly protein PilM [Victivallales bacterium]